MPADDRAQGERMQAVRRLRRLTRERMAGLLGVPHGRVREWEHGARTMSEVELEAVAYLLSVPIGYLARGVVGGVIALERVEAILQKRWMLRKRRARRRTSV